MSTKLSGAEALDELVRMFPGLDAVMKIYQRDEFVPVRLGLRTTPKDSSGELRHDVKVRGLYVVDRAQLHRANSDRLIKQDYLVVFTDGRTPTYYSGRWKDMPPEASLYFQPIDAFCASGLGVNGQYGCPDALNHHYAEHDPDLPQEPEFQRAFAKAVSEARSLEGIRRAPLPTIVPTPTVRRPDEVLEEFRVYTRPDNNQRVVATRTGRNGGWVLLTEDGAPQARLDAHDDGRVTLRPANQLVFVAEDLEPTPDKMYVCETCFGIAFQGTHPGFCPGPL